MGVPEIIRVLQASRNHPVANNLAIMWPSLAAELATLCEEHDVLPPYPFRTAATALRSEGSE